MHGALREMFGARACAGKLEPLTTARGPAIHRCRRHIGMELRAEHAAMTKSLDRKIVALGEQFATCGQIESLAVPLIDVVRPVGADHAPGLRRADRVVTHLAAAF